MCLVAKLRVPPEWGGERRKMITEKHGYNAMQEGYEKALKSHEFNAEKSLRHEKIGSWIVSLQKLGYGAAIYVYNAETLQEHWKRSTIGLDCSEDAEQETKDFYARILSSDWDFAVNLVMNWNK